MITKQEMWEAYRPLELNDLREAVRRWQRNMREAGNAIPPLSVRMLLEWKRGRGWLSCDEVRTPKSAEKWINGAVAYLKRFGIE